MKKQVLIIATALTTLAGCTSNLDPVPAPQGEGIFATIEQPALPFQTKSFSWDNNALKFSWGYNENVVVFGREGNTGKSDAALLRTLTSGEASSKLESKGFQLMDGINYYAYIPAAKFDITTDFRYIPLTFEGQWQDVKNSTATLKYYDYACAKATKASGANSLEFNLKNQVGWIVVEHLFTEETKGITSLTLSTTDPLFTSSCTLDATTSAISGNKYSTSLTLTLGTAAGFDFDKGEYSRAFFTTAPVDLSGKELTITAHKSDGTSIVLLQKTLGDCNIQKNSTVLIKTESAKTFKSVASINGRQFGSIEEAIATVINTGKKSTITLESEVKGPLTITNTLPRHAELILDLNGHSITSENEGECAVIVKQGEVRLKNGTIDSKKFVGVKLDSHAKGAKIYLNDCTVTSVEGAVCTGTATGCTITIYGGSFTATNNAVIAGNGSINYANTTEARDKGNTIIIDKSSKSGIPVINGYTAKAANVACGIYAPWKDDITINAAKINIENGVGILSRGGNIVINDAEIITTGGDRVGKVPDSGTNVPCKTVYIDKACDYPALENAAITIYGGKYSDDAGKIYVPSTYSYAETNESPLAYKVITNETKLIDAVSSVENNGTITIDYPVAPRNQLKIQKDFTLAMANGVLMEGDLQIPLLHFCQDNGTNVINGNGIIRGGQNSDETILVNGKGQTLTINSKDIRIEGGKSSEFAAAITVWDGKLVINDGTFVSGTDKSRNNSPAIYLMPMDEYDHAELEINGGTFKAADGASAQYLINCHDGSIAACKITIKGGTFVGFNPAASTGDTINGKPANWVAEGYKSVEDPKAPGTWIVRQK